MHGALAESRQLVDALRAGVTPGAKATMLLCPPFVYLPAVHGWLQGSPILLGAQDLADKPATGAYTGEVSGQMLRDVGCGHVIVGHSERRALYGETDAIVATKFKAAQVAGLIPIVCVGETLEQREAGQTRAVIERQVAAVVDSAGVQAFGKAVIAYEPVWAIGTGKVAGPAEAEEVHAAIRTWLTGKDPALAERTRILYGGSVKPDNAAALLGCPNIDGALVGGASLDAASFGAIAKAAESPTKAS